MPNQAGTGGTWNFQLHPAFWLGMALCDNQSAPEFTHAPCVPDSDTNIADGSDPNAADYIGKHTGTAFLELQFYPPGWAPWPPGVSCDAHKWCAAMAIFSLNNDYNNAIPNNSDCLNTVGIEPANFAFITLSGTPHAPPSPLEATDDTFTPHSSSDLFMNAGDNLVIDIHDTRRRSRDGHPRPDDRPDRIDDGERSERVRAGQLRSRSGACTQSPYAFHPMYSTSSEHTRVPWAAHSYNVAFSDEIGHFQYCATIPVEGGDAPTRRLTTTTRVLQRGVLAARAGRRLPRQQQRLRRNELPARLAGDRPEPRAGHEIPRGSVSSRARSSTGARTTHALPSKPTCRESRRPTSAATATGRRARTASTRRRARTSIRSTRPAKHGHDCCLAVGRHVPPGTKNTFGGNSTAEFGPLLHSVYPGNGFMPLFRYNNFRRILNSNPCPA